MKERIIEALKKVHRALNYEEIDSLLNLKTIEETKEMNEALESLENEGEIYHSNKNKYMLFSDSNLRKGTLRVNKKGFGFVEVLNEEDIFIPIDNINGALDKDTVAVEITETKTDGKREGRIARVLKRNLSTVVGEIYFKKGIGHIILDDKKLKLDIEIPKKKNMGAVDGHKVVVAIDSISKNKCIGRVIKILGHKNDPGVDILSIVEKYEIKYEFDKEVIEELDSIPEEISESDKKGRRDLTNQVIFTIDGDDTKDIDDAISVEKLSNGNYKLGVHIADVSYYVTEDTLTFKEAYDRGTSVYLCDTVIPMLPHKLSNGICSLNPEVERLAVSCVMEINDKGKVVDYDIFPSVIKSRKQMTYKNVNKVLDGETPDDYKEFEDKLKLMYELSGILRKDKLSRGYLDFDVPEPKIIQDEKGKAIDVKVRERGKGENLIEDFMIIANETVASHLFNLHYPSVYRIHEIPDDKKIKEFLNQISALGINVKGERKFDNPLSLRKIIDQLKDREDFDILSNMLLRCMQKAEYRSENLGHYGLASRCYTHFTSPIRRFPDTTLHTLLRKYLFNEPSPNELNKLIDEYEAKLPEICAHSSLKERNAIECERDVDDMKMAEYMEDHIGEEFEGVIDGIMNFGMFIQLPNLIEGLVKLESIKDDYYFFDEELNMLIGKNHKKKFKLGDKVKVKVIAASKETSTIDFVLVG